MLFIPHAIMCGFEELGSVDMAATVRFSRGVGGFEELGSVDMAATVRFSRGIRRMSPRRMGS